MTKKLGLRPGMRALLLNAPESYPGSLAPLPEGVQIDAIREGQYDFIQVFARDSQELQQWFPVALAALRPEGSLWLCYPKKSAGVESDLTRDEGWQVVRSAGWEPVTNVAIDATWSALRFKPALGEAEVFAAQYAGPKAALRPIYERLAAAAQALGPGVETGVRKTYVAFGRGKQFAVVQASTRERVDLGLKLPGVPSGGRLQEAGSFGSGGITHRVALQSVDEVDEEVLAWLRQAYAGVGK